MKSSGHIDRTIFKNSSLSEAGKLMRIGGMAI